MLPLWLLRHGHLLLIFVFVFSVAPSIARLRPGIDHLDLFDASLTHPVIRILVWAVKKNNVKYKVNRKGPFCINDISLGFSLYLS